MACSGWTPSFKKDHHTATIPDGIDESVLAKLLSGKRLADDAALDTLPCSRVISPSIGAKLKYCRVYQFSQLLSTVLINV